MKKITILFAAIALLASAGVNAAQLVKVAEPYALLKDGSTITGYLNDLCYRLAKDSNSYIDYGYIER